MASSVDEGAPTWAQKMSLRADVLRKDLRRLWLLEGPVAKASTSVLRRVRPRSVDHALEAHDAFPDSMPPDEVDKRRAGVGRGLRMSLVPRRNGWYATWTMGWNAGQSVLLAARCLVAMPAAEYVHGGVARALTLGVGRGVASAAQFAILGLVVSPIVHSTCGVRNCLHGVRNAVKGDHIFNYWAGHYIRADTIDDRENWEAREREFARAIETFRAEYRTSSRSTNRFLRSGPMGSFVAAMKARLNPFAKATGEATGNDPYEVLQVPRNATTAQIKSSYNRLAKVFHPDKNPDPEARKTFEKLHKAYKTLSDPKLREAHDVGGGDAAAAAQEMMTRQQKNTASVIKDGVIRGTPMAIVQAMFGGAPFEQLLIGPLYRSPFHINTQGGATVSITEFDAMQYNRARSLAATLGEILDAYAMAHIYDVTLNIAQDMCLRYMEDAQWRNVTSFSNSNARFVAPSRIREHAAAEQKRLREGKAAPARLEGPNPSTPKPKQPATPSPIDGVDAEDVPSAPDAETRPPVSAEYKTRCDRFAHRLSKCCFGEELLFEVGEVYVLSARRYLQQTHFYAPKKQQSSKTFAGFRRFIDALTMDIHKEGASQEASFNLFSMEYDNVVCDINVILRWACVCVCNDAGLELQVRKALGAPPKGTKTHVPAPGDTPTAKTTLGDVKTKKKPAHGMMIAPPPKSARARNYAASDRTEIEQMFLDYHEDTRDELIAAVTAEVQRRRCDALLALGQAFLAKGKRFGARGHADATLHLQQTIGKPENQQVPPVF